MNARSLLLAGAVAAAALAGTPVFAVSGSIQARIPFPFVVGDKVLPPADYIVDIAGTVGPSVLTIREMDSGYSVMFDTSQIPEKDDPKTIGLVFDRVGRTTYLMEVWGVTASGREVKHLVDGRPVERAAVDSRRRIAAERVIDGRDN
jgi:hypothetical protein